MTPLAHHAGEQGLAPLLLLLGSGGVSLLVAIARTRLAAARRQLAALARLGAPAPEPGRSTDRLAIEAGLRRLPLHYRQVLVLYYGADLPLEQVAQQLRLPPGDGEENRFDDMLADMTVVALASGTAGGEDWRLAAVRGTSLRSHEAKICLVHKTDGRSHGYGYSCRDEARTG